MQELAFTSLEPTPISSRIARRGAAARGPIEPLPEPPPSPLARPLPRRLGRYQLFAPIGSGGMADIHLAQADTGFGDAKRLVVVKEVRASFSTTGEFAEMLVSEAKLAARLCHANIVKVEDLGRAGDGLFIAMEYVEGLDLRELLRRCAKARVALPVDFSLRIVIEALRGLSFAHRAKGDLGAPLGIVHRDVSPSNVLLSFDGEVKLCDFGIARANALAGGLGAVDAGADAIVGKAGYMSPEQARGEALDARADVFAAGIILWELLSGRRLYRAREDESVLDLAREAKITELVSHDLPRERELHAIVARALAADRDARYPSAAAMLEDLEEYAASTCLVASPIRFGEWLMENFGHDVVHERRARERAMRALARGPALVIQALPRTEPAAESPASSSPVSFLPDYESTPSAFMVAVPAGAAAPATLAELETAPPVAALDEAAIGLPGPLGGARLLWASLALVALLYLAVRLALLPL